MKTKTEQYVRRLERVEFFRCVGLQDLKDVVVVDSWNEGMKFCADKEYGEFLLQVSNLFRKRLFLVSRDLLNSTIDIDKEIRPVCLQLCKRVDPFVSSLGLSKVFMDTVQWHFLAGLTELEYCDVVEPSLCVRHLDVYLAGHFPCGWEGEYPKGRLIVF